MVVRKVALLLSTRGCDLAACMHGAVWAEEDQREPNDRADTCGHLQLEACVAKVGHVQTGTHKNV